MAFSRTLTLPELLVWLGISAGYEALERTPSRLAIRFLIVGLIVCLIKGIVTEKLYLIMKKRNEAKLYSLVVQRKRRI